MQNSSHLLNSVFPIFKKETLHRLILFGRSDPHKLTQCKIRGKTKHRLTGAWSLPGFDLIVETRPLRQTQPILFLAWTWAVGVAMKNSCRVLQRSTYVLNICWLHVTWKLQSESTPWCGRLSLGAGVDSPETSSPSWQAGNTWQDAVTYPLNHVKGKGGEQQGYHGGAARPFGLLCCLKILFLISTFFFP